MTRARRWIVVSARSLRRELAAQSPDDPTAAVDGRVFVNGRRTTSDVPLTAGDVLEIARARAPVAPAVTMIEVRDGLVIVDKPAGLPTEPDRRGSAGSLIHLVAETLRVPPGTLHATSRLDVGVSGVVVLTQSRQARELVAKWRKLGTLRRRYLGIGAGQLDRGKGAGVWRAALPRDPRPALTHFTTVATVSSAAPALATAGRPTASEPPTVSSAAPALATAGRPTASEPPISFFMFALEPQTGRLHQLRAHTAAAGAALLGDRAHHGLRRWVTSDGSVLEFDRVALHCAVVESAERRWSASPPPSLVDWWKRLGGSPEAWSAGLEVSMQ